MINAWKEYKRMYSNESRHLSWGRHSVPLESSGASSQKQMISRMPSAEDSTKDRWVPAGFQRSHKLDQELPRPEIKIHLVTKMALIRASWLLLSACVLSKKRSNIIADEHSLCTGLRLHSRFGRIRHSYSWDSHCNQHSLLLEFATMARYDRAVPLLLSLLCLRSPLSALVILRPGDWFSSSDICSWQPSVRMEPCTKFSTPLKLSIREQLL